jgi:preprotein translocase subunit SecA
MAAMSINLESLSDDELARQAVEWRRRALQGEQDANDRAHVLERELRRRQGGLSTLGAELRAPARRRTVWWAFWKR